MECIANRYPFLQYSAGFQKEFTCISSRINLNSYCHGSACIKPHLFKALVKFVVKIVLSLVS